MPRRTAYVLLGALLLACALGFARAEQLKLRVATVGGPSVPRFWSPRCDAGPDCTPAAEIGFQLRRPALVTVRVVDDRGAPVRTLLAPQRRPRGPVELRWDGRTDGGSPAPEGRYHVEVELVADGRTMELPTALNLDRTAPHIAISDVRRAGRTVVVRYASSEPAIVFLAVARALRGGGREPVAGSLVRGRRGRAVWDAAGAPPGRYVLTLTGRDRAGIRAVAPAVARIRLR